MKRVILHFDLNRTVLMSDAVGGRSMENTINYLLTECCWGYVDERTEKWICVSTTPSVEPPQSHLITYKAFVDLKHPYQSIGQQNDVPIDQIKAHNKMMKKKRTALQSDFTSKSSPGESVVSSFHQVMEKLSFPTGEQRLRAKKHAERMEDCRLKEAWIQGRYYLLPSFLNALFQIHQLNNKNKSNICLVFRTFGDDIPEVAREIDYLIQGEHPLFPGMKLPPEYGLRSPYSVFYRAQDTTHLITGTLDKMPSDGRQLDEFYKKHSIACGFPAIQAQIHQLLADRRVTAIRDYWEWWSAHGEHAEYGKVLIVNDSNTHSVFYDDHVEHTEAHIVDVRDCSTGNPVTFEEATKRHLIKRVEPYLAITDESYYTKCLTQLLEEI